MVASLRDAVNGLENGSVQRTAPRAEAEFSARVLAHLTLGDEWREAVLRALATEGPEPDHALEIKRIDGALANLRKHHLWGAVTDEDFKDEFQSLQRQRQSLEPRPLSNHLPNLDRAGRLLQELPALWQHPGVTPQQRRELAREVF